MSPPVTPADRVLAQDGLREAFFRRHAKDKRRADDAWAALIGMVPWLLENPLGGEPVRAQQRPARFRGLPNLHLIPELPHRFRALYSFYEHPEHGRLVSIEWVGDHKEYDELFGYRTS
jgi:hypothetical protein